MNDPEELQIQLESLHKEIRAARALIPTPDQFPDAPKGLYEQFFLLRTQIEVLRTKCTRLRALSPASPDSSADKHGSTDGYSGPVRAPVNEE